MLDKFSSDQLIAGGVALLVFILVMSIVLTSHRTSIACINAGGNPSTQAHKRCSF